MAKDLDWYFREIVNGNHKAEQKFFSEFFDPCVMIIVSDIFGMMIPDIPLFAQVLLKNFIQHIKSNGLPTNDKKNGKIFRNFIIEKIHHNTNEQFKILALEVQNGSKSAESKLRRYETSILMYIDQYFKYSERPCDHQLLAEKIMDEWIKMARRGTVGKDEPIESYPAIFMHNLKLRMMDKLSGIYEEKSLLGEIKKRLNKIGSIFQSTEPDTDRKKNAKLIKCLHELYSGLERDENDIIHDVDIKKLSMIIATICKKNLSELENVLIYKRIKEGKTYPEIVDELILISPKLPELEDRTINRFSMMRLYDGALDKIKEYLKNKSIEGL